LNGNIYLVRYGHYLLIRSIHPLPIHSMSWAENDRYRLWIFWSREREWQSSHM